MKKRLFILLIAAVPSIMMAQLSVLSNGKVFIKDGSLSSTANLTISDAPYLGFVSDDISANVGTRSQGYATSSGLSSIGVIGEGYKQNGNGVSIGVWGEAYGSLNQNFGLVGMSNMTNNSAGIYATTEGNLNYFTSGCYAGYFVGSTYVDGSLTASAFYNLSDRRLKENATPLSEIEKGLSPLSKLQNLEVIEYNLKHPSNLKEVSEKKHYGVYAQELQELYPDLVQEGQDGYLTVNYVEMVPLLLRSIQELKQEIDELKGCPQAKSRSISGESADFSAVTGNVLYQNTPNPFKEQTVIRFSLADDVRDASISIFDMTGKTIKKLSISSGMNSVSVGGYELGEGMFLYSLIVNGQVVDTKRMVISK